MVSLVVYEFPDKFIVKTSGYDIGIIENIKKCKPRQWDPVDCVWYIGNDNYNNFLSYLDSERIP